LTRAPGIACGAGSLLRGHSTVPDRLRRSPCGAFRTRCSSDADFKSRFPLPSFRVRLRTAASVRPTRPSISGVLDEARLHQPISGSSEVPFRASTSIRKSQRRPRGDSVAQSNSESPRQRSGRHDRRRSELKPIEERYSAAASVRYLAARRILPFRDGG